MEMKRLKSRFIETITGVEIEIDKDGNRTIKGLRGHFKVGELRKNRGV